MKIFNRTFFMFELVKFHFRLKLYKDLKNGNIILDESNCR